MNLRRSARWFPVVGLILGSISALLAFVLNPLLSPLIVGSVLLGLDALLTGALHLDGLADMADGFGRKRSREDTLRIMRDHAIGSYGGVALVLVFLTKAACLQHLLAQATPWRLLLTVPAFARWSILFCSRLAPYARDNDGTPAGSGALARNISAPDFMIATLCCLALLALSPSLLLSCWASACVISLGIVRLSRSRVGGITGDILGANLLLCETAQLVVASVHHPQ